MPTPFLFIQYYEIDVACKLGVTSIHVATLLIVYKTEIIYQNINREGDHTNFFKLKKSYK